MYATSWCCNSRDVWVRNIENMWTVGRNFRDETVRKCRKEQRDMKVGT